MRSKIKTIDLQIWRQEENEQNIVREKNNFFSRGHILYFFENLFYSGFTFHIKF
jgi:hypothetical protein